jgi:ribosomal protein L16
MVTALLHTLRTRIQLGVARSAIVRQETRRFRSNLAPRRTKYRKAQKGRIPLPIGGSLAGTTLTLGEYGLRIRVGARLTADQLSAALNTIKRKIKTCKSAQVFLRVFPDIPVTRKGNEVRMGKGKGAHDHWACRVAPGRIVLEIRGGSDLRPELAKEAIRLAGHKFPVPTEFVDKAKLMRLAQKEAKAALEKAEAVPAAKKA